MENKKPIEEAFIEKITGGRHYAHDLVERFKGLDKLAKIPLREKDELMKSAVSVDSLPKEELPAKLLDKVAGGVNDDDWYLATCPNCRSHTFYTIDTGGSWMLMCLQCDTLVDASWL